MSCHCMCRNKPHIRYESKALRVKDIPFTKSVNPWSGNNVPISRYHPGKSHTPCIPAATHLFSDLRAFYLEHMSCHRSDHYLEIAGLNYSR